MTANRSRSPFTVPAYPGMSGPMLATMLFRALAHRNFRLYLFGQGVSVLGTWMQQVAVYLRKGLIRESAVAIRPAA
jgi:hypothetical protein